MPMASKTDFGFSHAQMIPGSDGLTGLEAETESHRTFNILEEPMSLLENCEDPDSFVLPDYGKMVEENLKNHTSSQELLDASHQRQAVVDNACKTTQHIKKDMPSDLDSQLFFWDIPSHLRSNNVTGLSRNSSGCFCAYCYRVFPSYEKYDDHLPCSDFHTDMLAEPVSVALRTESNVPTNYGVRYRFPKFLLNSLAWQYKCSSCGKREFESRGEFHQHLVLCGSAIHSEILTAMNATTYTSNYKQKEATVYEAAVSSNGTTVTGDCADSFNNRNAGLDQDDDEIEF